MIPDLFPMRVITLRGIRHELDPSGSWCIICQETSDYLLESGGEGSY